MGFGLFVPAFKSSFSLTPATVGLISSLGFAGFFIGLLVAQYLLNRKGPAAPVLTGLAAATLGLGVVALAPNATVLAAGVFLAASSAGFAWTPFNDAVHRKIRDADRPTALSEISTGTSVGVMLAAAIALGMVFTGLDWRICWGVFALLALASLIGNWAALRPVGRAPEAAPDASWRMLLQQSAVPLFGLAFVFGITSSVYISFAADHFSQSSLLGMPNSAVPSVVFLSYGFFGLAGLLTGTIRDRIGLAPLVRLLLLAAGSSFALAALLSDSWTALVISAGLQGINVMMTSAVLAFWSEKLFPSLPSMSFTATLLATASGSVIGPSLAGLVLKGPGPEVAFLGTAAIPLIAAFALRQSWITEQALEPA
jgi:predicted MFS family arabinose efflux permease